MMFWNRNKKDKATIANEKKRFNHLLSVAEKGLRLGNGKYCTLRLFFNQV